MVHIIAFSAFFAFCLLFSWRYGGAPERVAMLAQATAAVLTIAAIFFVPHLASFRKLAAALFVIDVGLCITLTIIALRANRLWTIVLAGLQLSTVIAHLSKALFPALPAASYGIFAQFWAWPMLVTTLIGALQHRARLRKSGCEPNWRPLWLHSVQSGSTV